MGGFCSLFRIGARGPNIGGSYIGSRFLGSSLKMEYLGQLKSSCTCIEYRVWAVPHVVTLCEQRVPGVVCVACLRCDRSILQS